MATLQLIAELPGHAEPAWQVAFNPTRNLLASCSTDKTFRLYSYALPKGTSGAGSNDTNDGITHHASLSGLPKVDDPKPVFNLVGVTKTEHKRTIRSIAWAPSGRTLATGSFDSTVGVWEEIDPEDDDSSVNSEVHDEAMDLDDDKEQGAGKAVGKKEKFGEWECVTALEGHESECKSVGFSSDGGLLASCSRDKSVWVWEVQPDADFECIAVLMEHSQDVKTIAWHPKEEILASASYDSHIHLLFDDPDGDWCPFQKLHPKLPPAPLTIESPSPSLRSALERNEEDEAIERLAVPPLEEDETVWSLGWSPCGRYLASGGDMGGIRIWTRRGTNPDSPFDETVHTSAHSRSVFSLSWTTGGLPLEQGGLGLLASAGGDGKVIVWQVSTSPDQEDGVRVEPIAAVRNAHGVSDVNSVHWCVREGGQDGPKGSMLASCGDDGTVKVWRVAVGQ